MNNPIIMSTLNPPVLHATDEKQAVQLQAMRKMLKDPITRMLRDLNAAICQFFLQPQKILKVGRVTVVFWEDGSSTAVKCGENEIPDDYVAFCAALGKKVFGTNSALKRAFMDAPMDIRFP